MSDYEPKVGDRVSWWEHGYRNWGNVVRVTKATAFVMLDGGAKEIAFRRSKYHGWGISPETDAERAEKQWIAEQPETKRAIIVGLAVGQPRVRVADMYADDIRAVIADLETIAAWLDKRPEGA